MGRKHFCLAVLLLGLLTASCNLDDSRDTCYCGGCSVVDFAYTLKYTDCFDSYISSMQYYLFDASDGHYLGQMYGEDDDLSVVSLDGLWSGSFSLVGIGNLDDYGTLTGLDEGLDSLRLVVSQAYDGDTTDSSDSSPIYANGDLIYWGQCDFTLTDDDALQTFAGEMAALHCRMLIRVVWESLPEYTEGYVMELAGIATETELCSANATTLYGNQQFPPVSGFTGRMREDVTLRQLALQASLYTLRCTDDNLPTFRLLHDGTSVITDIDLAEVFEEWAWHPDQAWIQDYQMLVTIRTDGQVELSMSLTGDVSDWEEGGTLG